MDLKRHIILCLAITLCILSFVSFNSVSALTEQRDVNVSFTFNSTLSVSVSNPDLVIDDLVPGTAADSNIINVNVLSNSPYGYTLNSTVGSTTYNTRNLTHSTSPSSTPFSSINYGTTVATKESLDPSQWGYSYSLDNGTTWINTNKTNGTTNDTGYSGLPLYSDTTNIATLKESNSTTSTSGDNVKFKIAAKADTVQIAGEYNNVINFQVTGNPEPAKDISNATYLQEVGTCPSTLTTGQVYTLKDNRDEQEYKVAKLADNKCWMVENLNLAGGTALSSTDTNVTDAYISSFTTSNNLTKSGNTIVLPASSTSGFNTDNYSYVYNSGNKTSTCTSPGCYSYYSWDAATLGSGRSISTDNTNAEQSICPKGWKLPSTYNGSGTAAAATDFRALMIGYGGSDSIQSYTSSTNPTGATMYSRIGPGSTPNFLLAGYYYSGSFDNGGSRGSYWSSTSYSDTYYSARGFLFYSTYSTVVYSANYDDRRAGKSVRCLFSE